MKKQILGGIIIGLIIVGGIVGIGYYKYSAEQKTANDYAKMLEGMTDEQKIQWVNQQLQSMNENMQSTCDNLTAKISESDCAKLVSSSKDACYYCFAVKDQNQNLCASIIDSSLKQTCQTNSGSSTNSTANTQQENNNQTQVSGNDNSLQNLNDNDLDTASYMDFMRSTAELIYVADNGYQNFNCNNAQMQSDCSKVEKYSGAEPTFHSIQTAYCTYVKLSSGYYCIDSNGNSLKTSINPGTTGNCLGQSYKCPTK